MRSPLRAILGHQSVLENFCKADRVLKLFATGLLSPAVLRTPPLHLHHPRLPEYRLVGEKEDLGVHLRPTSVDIYS